MFLNCDLEVTAAKAGKLFPRWATPHSPFFYPSVVHLSISMLMPCNDLRRIGMKEKERNLFSARLCSAFCCCCYSNAELKLTQQCVFAWQDGDFSFSCWKERVGEKRGETSAIYMLHMNNDNPNCQRSHHRLTSYLNIEEIKYQSVGTVISSSVLIS